MPDEGELFEEVDMNWKDIMSNSLKDPRALVVVSKRDMLDKLQTSITLLETINRGLNAYLEKKRLFFPRFFFLSNDELLEILSETKDPLRVQPHLKKCFEGIHKLTFDPNKIVLGMQSAENESVPFSKEIIPSNAGGLVEVWLQQVEQVMKLSLRAQASRAIGDYYKLTRAEWISNFPGQILLATNCIFWTSQVTKVFT